MGRLSYILPFECQPGAGAGLDEKFPSAADYASLDLGG